LAENPPSFISVKLLQEKVQMLLNRERELQTVRQKFHSYVTWMDKVQKLTASMSIITDPQEALTHLLQCLVDDFGYESSALVEAPPCPIRVHNVSQSNDSASLLDVAKVVQKEGKIVVREISPEAGSPSGFAWIMGGLVLHEAGSQHVAFVLLVGRTPRTAIFYRVPQREEIELFQYLLDATLHAYAAVKYRFELTGERNCLQLKVEEATKQLLRSEKMSAVGQLAAGVAHEINNPLGVILGFSQALAARIPAGGPLGMAVQSIEREVLRCKNLVQDLLTFSRTSQLDQELLDINKTIEGALSLVQAEARITKVNIRQDMASHLPPILGNKTQIQQVVINLANNALDAMSKGGTLNLKTELVEGIPKSWVSLTISDTGPGIPPEVLTHIFEPFFTTKPVGQGTGLGLSLVHEIMQKHSGIIDVRSSPGNTEFRLKFPIRTGRELEERKTEVQKEQVTKRPYIRNRFSPSKG